MREVTLRIEEDIAKPPGHARLCLIGLSATGDLRFRLRDVRTGELLGAAGWQPGDVLLQPDRATAEGSDLALEIGPSIVDHVHRDTRIELEIPGVDVRARGFWPDMAVSLGASRATVQVRRRPSPPAPTPPPAAPEEGAKPELWPAPADPPEPASAATPPPPPGAPGGRRVWVGLLALLLVAAAVAGGAWHRGWIGPASTTADPAPPPTAPPADLLARLRDLDGQGGAPGDYLQLAQQAQGQGNADVAALAIAVPIREGYGPALLQMGRWYDPRHQTTAGSPFRRPNSLQAAENYRKAKAAGEADAAGELEGLCRHLAETNGDALAREKACSS